MLNAGEKTALVLNHNLRERGTYFRAWRVAVGLARRGWRVTFMTTSEALYRPRHGIRDGVDVWEMPSSSPVHFPDEGWSPLNVLWRGGVGAVGRFDIVYTFSHRPVDQIPARLLSRLRDSFWICDWCDLYNGSDGLNAMARRARGPAKTWREKLHDRADSIDEQLEKHAATRCQMLTVISSFLADRALQLGVDPEHLHPMPSGADLEAIQPLDSAHCRQTWNIPQSELLLGYVANFHPDETLLLDALKIIFEQRPHVSLIVAGHDFYGGQEALASRGIHNRIRHFGRIPFSRIGSFLGAADLLLVPMTDTPYNRSRWPNKIGDYLAAGRPQVACAVGDVKPLLQKHFVGLGCAPDKNAFARAIIELIDNGQKRAEMGRNARTVAEAHFNWDQIIDRLVERIEWLRNHR